MSIEEAVKAKIVDLQTDAEGRVFRGVIDQEPVMPAIAFWRTGSPEVRRDVETGQQLLQRATIRVEVIARTLAESDSVAEALRAGLDGWHGLSAGVEVLRCAMTFQGDASTADGDLLLRIVQQDYDVTYR